MSVKIALEKGNHKLPEKDILDSYKEVVGWLKSEQDITLRLSEDAIKIVLNDETVLYEGPVDYPVSSVKIGLSLMKTVAGLLDDNKTDRLKQMEESLRPDRGRIII